MLSIGGRLHCFLTVFPIMPFPIWGSHRNSRPPVMSARHLSLVSWLLAAPQYFGLSQPWHCWRALASYSVNRPWFASFWRFSDRSELCTFGMKQQKERDHGRASWLLTGFSPLTRSLYGRLFFCDCQILGLGLWKGGPTLPPGKPQCAVLFSISQSLRVPAALATSRVLSRHTDPWFAISLAPLVFLLAGTFLRGIFFPFFLFIPFFHF